VIDYLFPFFIPFSVRFYVTWLELLIGVKITVLLEANWGAHVGLSVNDWTWYKFIFSSLLNQLELETLAFTIVASVATRGIRFLNVKSAQRILIIGAGFIGICAAQLA